MIGRWLYRLVRWLSGLPRWLPWLLLGVLVVAPFLGIIAAKYYEDWDDDFQRGAVASAEAALDERYDLPEYLDQGWETYDSLWFYNTTQGSALLPYAFLLALEQPEPEKGRADNPPRVECRRNGRAGPWFLCPANIDRLRYLPQKHTFFNPDALPVGFVKETYQGRDYVGYTCAACHTGQVNYRGRALRIDGGPAMADMVAFLSELTRALDQTGRRADQDKSRLDRFVDQVLALNHDYRDRAAVERDLKRWTDVRELYNRVNRSRVDGRALPYGYARLDAFGRIYNRVIQYAITPRQLRRALLSVTTQAGGQRLLTAAEVDRAMAGVAPDALVLGDGTLWRILEALRPGGPGHPERQEAERQRILDSLFNSPNAPVSYPFLWDITRSDYVQWNGLASNAALGPLGRNAGEVIGVFAKLDWHRDRGLGARFERFSLAAWLSGQHTKRAVLNFQSSIDLFNLQRLERKLGTLKSPRWPFCRHAATGDYYLPGGPAGSPVDLRPCEAGDRRIDPARAARGELLFARRCAGCHSPIDRDAADRLMVSKMLGIDSPQSTDKAMASNSVGYRGKSGNFENTYQETPAGTLVVPEEAPVAMILTAATRGVVATPDADKGWPRRVAEWLYTLVMSFTDNPIRQSVKAGHYTPDTTAGPFNSLQAYRGRSLKGVWATAPYLHNGSVPTLYDLLLPATPGAGCPAARPETFQVGAREFDPVKVGFRSQGYAGFTFDTRLRGNHNTGHEYGACGLSDAQRWDLVEYLKSL